MQDVHSPHGETLPGSRNYRALFDAIDEGFCIIEMIYGDDGQGVDYRFLEVNRMFEVQTGLVDPVGRTARELVPGLEDRWPRIYGQVALSGQPQRFTEGSDAMGRWFDVYAFCMDPEARREVAIVFKDVSTERMALNDLREKDRLKDEFLAMLAHELRNPMVPIQAALYQLREAPDSDQARRVAATIDRQMQQLVRLVDDLMEVSRVTRGKLALHSEPLELQYVLDTAAEATAPTLAHWRDVLSLTLPPEPVMVEGDAVRLTQVFTNLLNNAVKYSPKGSRIAMALCVEGEDAVVTVTDEGIGLPPDRLEYIFELFSQLGDKGATVEGGLGIGLTLVRSLVQLHGGSVVAESDGPGQGSRFIVRLPVLRASAQGRDVVADVQASGMLEGLRVLMVDDHREIRDVFVEWLLALGAEVRECTDGESALRVAASWQPHAVILDLGMPGISGWEAARRMRVSGLPEPLLLIAVSGWGQPSDIERSRRAGFDEHFTKPPPMARLHAALAGHRQRLFGKGT